MTKYLIASLIIAVNVMGICYAEDWQLAQTKQDIKVYLKDNPNSSYKSFKGQVVIKASARKIAEALEDTKNACKWLYSCKSFKIIAKKDKEYWAYGQTTMPWPTTDRDVVLYSLLQEQPDGAISVKMTAEPTKLPEVKGYVRVTKVDGLWQFIPIDKNTTQVIYQSTIEPGGSIPAWLANQYVMDSPFETLKALRSYMETGNIK